MRRSQVGLRNTSCLTIDTCPVSIVLAFSVFMQADCFSSLILSSRSFAFLIFLPASGCYVCFVNMSQRKNWRRKIEIQQAGLSIQVPAREVLGNVWKLFKDHVLRKLKVPQEEENETSTILLLSPISSGLQEEDSEDLLSSSSTPAFDWDWEEKVSIIAEDEEEVNATDFESENVIDTSDIDIVNVSVLANVIDSVENTSVYTVSENDSVESEKAKIIETEEDQTDENEELHFKIDPSETSDNRSVGMNLTNQETEGISMEEPVDASEDSFLEDVEMEADGGEVEDMMENTDKIRESMGSPFDATFSPQRNRGRVLLASSLFSTSGIALLLLLCPFL